MSKLVLMPRRAPVRTRSSDTIDMALLAISPIGGMKKIQYKTLMATKPEKAMELAVKRMLPDNTIDAARVMAIQGDKQLSVPGVMEGTVDPDYNALVETAAKEALRKMLVPSMLAIAIPVVGGFVFGAQFVGGLLVGATICAIPRAIFMGNSGGAFDNAKKYSESGAIEGHGKGTAAHKAAVTGDTVGDTRKDVVGVALDIFIKMMSSVANTLVGLFRV